MTSRSEGYQPCCGAGGVDLPVELRGGAPGCSSQPPEGVSGPGSWWLDRDNACGCQRLRWPPPASSTSLLAAGTLSPAAAPPTNLSTTWSPRPAACCATSDAADWITSSRRGSVSARPGVVAGAVIRVKGPAGERGSCWSVALVLILTLRAARRWSRRTRPRRRSVSIAVTDRVAVGVVGGIRNRRRVDAWRRCCCWRGSRRTESRRPVLDDGPASIVADAAAWALAGSPARTAPQHGLVDRVAAGIGG